MNLSGQCHCGNIEFEVKDDEHIVRTDCNCRECQHATGSFEIPFVSINPSKLTFKKGKGKIFKAKAGEQCDKNGRWMFCENCGSMLMWMEDNNQFYTLLAGVLNETEIVRSLPKRQ